MADDHGYRSVPPPISHPFPEITVPRNDSPAGQLVGRLAAISLGWRDSEASE